MAKEPVKKEIDGLTFEFFPLPPKEALKVLTRLTKVLGEPLGLIGDAVSGGLGSGEQILKSLLDGRISPDIFGKATRALVDRLDENEVESTVMILISKVHGKFEKDVGTRQLNFDLDFAGRIGLLLKVVYASLEVNFSDFFSGGIGGLLTRSRDLRDSIPVI